MCADHNHHHLLLRLRAGPCNSFGKEEGSRDASARAIQVALKQLSFLSPAPFLVLYDISPFRHAQN